MVNFCLRYNILLEVCRKAVCYNVQAVFECDCVEAAGTEQF